MKGLIVLREGKPFTTSLIMADGLNADHEYLVRLLKDYSHTETLSRLQNGKLKTKGRPIIVYYLDEQQATFLITLMKNTPIVVKFKEQLVKAFFKYRKFCLSAALVKGTPEYIELREKTKVTRLEETDTIKKFVNYATDQGSKNAHMYYANISKMENKALFFIDQKIKNVRELLDFRQLALIQVADQGVIAALEEGMQEGLPYKDIYVKAKERIEILARVIPKSPLALLAMDNSEV
jgi:phage regulator Rha-like protein